MIGKFSNTKAKIEMPTILEVRLLDINRVEFGITVWVILLGFKLISLPVLYWLAFCYYGYLSFSLSQNNQD